MNRREFLRVFTFGVAAATLPSITVPAETPELGVPFERADGATVVCFRAGETLKAGQLVAVTSDNYAFTWKLSGPGRLNGLASQTAEKDAIVTVMCAANLVQASPTDSTSVTSTIRSFCERNRDTNRIDGCGEMPPDPIELMDVECVSIAEADIARSWAKYHEWLAADTRAPRDITACREWLEEREQSLANAKAGIARSRNKPLVLPPFDHVAHRIAATADHDKVQRAMVALGVVCGR